MREGDRQTALRLAHLLAVGCGDEGSGEGKHLLLVCSPAELHAVHLPVLSAR